MGQSQQSTRRRRLSDDERLFLASAAHRADESMKDIAPLLGWRVHRCHYIRDSLISRGIIECSRPFVDYFALGLSEFAFFISLGAVSKKSLDGLQRELAAEPMVAWVAVACGEYDLVVSFIAQNAQSAAEALRRILAHNDIKVSRQDLAIRSRFAAFGRRGIAPQPPPGPIFEIASSLASQKLTTSEVDVLSSLSYAKFESLRELALKIDMPHSTFARITDSLRKRGIIRGFYYRYSIKESAHLNYRIILKISTNPLKLWQQLRKLCADKPQITHLVETVGAWDYEFAVEVSESLDLREIVWEIMQTVKNFNPQVHTFQILAHTHSAFFPFPGFKRS